jgi:vitamin B12 transporter
VISGQDLTNARASFATTLFRNVPGIAVSSSGGFGANTQLRLRGSEGNHVLVLINGVEVNDGSQSDEFNMAQIPGNGIEKIEIIRGPQSSLWGSDSIGGVINIITKRTENATRGGIFIEQGNLELGNYGFGFGHSNEKFQVNVDGSRFSSEGNNISRTGNEKDGYKNTTFNFNSFLATKTEARFDFIARIDNGVNEFDSVAFALPEDSESWTEFSRFFLQAGASYNLLDNFWQQRITLSRGLNSNKNFEYSNFDSYTSAIKKKVSYLNSFNLDDISRNFSMLLEYEKEEFGQQGVIQPWGDPNHRGSRSNKSIALEYNDSIGENLNFAIGGRYDDNSGFDNADTLQVSASYRSQLLNTRFRGGIGTGVKNPTFTERYGYYTNFLGNPALMPEKSTSWEVGADKNFFGEKLTFQVTYFHSDLINEINGFVFDQASNLFTANNLAGRSKRRGVEMAATASISDKLTLNSSYSYIKSTEMDTQNQDVDELRRPRHLASFTLNWAIRENISMSVNAQYNGKQKDLDFSTFPATFVVLDDFTRVNLTATYNAANHISLYVRADNLFDRTYEEVFGFRTADRVVKMGISYDFLP